tara:strand:+ start:227 stop:1267 length:1041 start_codon:yes stop_codon:yes gene_type:complete
MVNNKKQIREKRIFYDCECKLNPKKSNIIVLRELQNLKINNRNSKKKYGLIIGRSFEEELHKEEGWVWVSLDRDDLLLRKNNPKVRTNNNKYNKSIQSPYHIFKDMNDSKMHTILSKIGFDKVIVDFSTIKFLRSDQINHFIWEYLHKLLNKHKDSKLIVEFSPHLGQDKPDSVITQFEENYDIYGNITYRRPDKLNTYFGSDRVGDPVKYYENDMEKLERMLRRDLGNLFHKIELRVEKFIGTLIRHPKYIKAQHPLTWFGKNKEYKFLEITGAKKEQKYENEENKEEKDIGGRRKRKKVKKVRKHKGIVQTGGNKGRLKKGYRYSGKKLKNGLSQIIKCKSKKC